MLDSELVAPVETAVRSLATAARTLRLYPASSPIPRQSVEAAVEPLQSCLKDRSALTLTIAREGFTCDGTPVGGDTGGAADLADELRAHGVAGLAFLPGCSADELLSLLGVVLRDATEVRGFGGIAAMLESAGVKNVGVSTVTLAVTSAQMEQPAEGEGVDEFFRELAFDGDKLATWLAAATKGDASTLAAGLAELANAAGADGSARFLAAFSDAFMSQKPGSRDALLTLGLDDDTTRDLLGGMFPRLAVPDVAGTLTEGVFGKNMLSLSTALTRLPLGQRMNDVIAEVRRSLERSGREEREVAFLDHMLGVRALKQAEQPVIERDPVYNAVLEASRVAPAMLAHTREEAAGAVGRIDARAVTTMLALLDQQRDFDLYVGSLDRLAGMVPHLMRQGELGLAVTVLHEIADRESHATQPWPELTQRLRGALAAATGRPTMSALLDALLADPDTLTDAHAVMLIADDGAVTALVEEALSRRDDGALQMAETLLGARVTDGLVAAAARVAPSDAGRMARLLLSRNEPRAQRALETLLARPDETSRAEAAEALASSRLLVVVPLLARLLRDPSQHVAAAAARALAAGGLPGAAQALAQRLEELDVDNRDFAAARELIGRLAQMNDPAATEALRKLADRKQLLKRGHFADVQQLAREGLAAQSRRVGR